MKYIEFTFLLFVFCSGFSCTYTSDKTGQALINMRLIDAPGDFDEVWIEIEGVEVMQSRDRQGNDNHWVFIPYDQVNPLVDVSKLVGTGVLLLGRTEVPVGYISKIKLMLGDDLFLTKGGNRRSLTLQSPEDAFIEMDVNYELQSNISYDIYLDFDLERSIKPTNDSMQFLLEPAVRSFVRENRSEITGKIQPLGARPVIYAIQGKDTVTTLTDIQGSFTLRGLEEGKHQIVIWPAPPYLDTVFSVKTEAGNLTTIENITLRLNP